MPQRVFIDIEGKAVNGRLIVELDSNAPKLSENFRQLCGRKNYVGASFHRVVAPEFIIQAGDITSNIEPVKDENVVEVKLGDVCAANAGPNTTTTQFFIALGSSIKAPVFGRVVKGLDLLKGFASVQVDENDAPVPGEEIRIVRTGALEYRPKPLASNPPPPVDAPPPTQPNTRLVGGGVKRVAEDSHRDKKRTSKPQTGDGIVLKGRGAMKFRETRDEYRLR